MSDEEMVAYLVNCMIDSKHPRASIETLLHAFCHSKTLTTRILMRLSLSAAHIMDVSLPKKFMAIVSYGYLMYVLALHFPK